MPEDYLEGLKQYFPDKSGILNLVDDYTLFCYYMNEEVFINQVILSPLRDPLQDQPDTKPSFAVYESRYNKLKYYDHGKGGKGGDIFDFVQELYGLRTLQEACVKIAKDFGLGIYTGNEETRKDFLVPGEVKIKPKVQIKDVICYPELTPAGKTYWGEYYITDEILEEYRIKQVQTLITDRAISRMQNLAFSYRIGSAYKIYQPFEPDHKFINNYPPNYVEGLYQLTVRDPPKDLLIITKSTKDIAVLRLLGYNAVSPKAETTLIPEYIQTALKEQYTRIVMLFDNDKAGIKGADKYPFEKIWIPEESKLKDISDFIKQHGPQETYELMLHLLN